MNLKQLRAQVMHLNKLSTGLARGESRWRKEMAFPMHSERALYLSAIYLARTAVEEARNTLTKVCERLKSSPVKRDET